MEKRFNKGDYVVYGKNGVCLVEDIKSMLFGGENGTYYILKPTSSSFSTVYVPVDKEILVDRMRPVLNKKQIDEILSSSKDCTVEWIESKNERHEYFNSVVSSGDLKKLIAVVMTLYAKKSEKEAVGKHISSTDENILKSAEYLIEEEFSFGLGCSAGKVGEYIRKKLG